jgi:hypothetical protein
MEEKTAMVFSNTLIRALRMIKEGKSREILEEGL